MREIVSSIGELLSYSEAAFDHTGVQFGGLARKFTRAPRGAKDVYKSSSNNPKLSITYVLCASKKLGALPGYYIIPESVASTEVYKNAYAMGFRNHVKNRSFKNQRELGCWVIKSARKYDHDLLEN